jgi:hypothetical protein
MSAQSAVVRGGAMTAKWFNPITSARQNESVPAANAGSHTFVKPVAWSDAVSLLSGGDRGGCRPHYQGFGVQTPGQ